MYIQSNAYYFKDSTDNIFSIKMEQEHPIEHFVLYEDNYIFSSKNELYSSKDKKIKKILSFKAEITTLTVQESLLCVGTSDGEVQIFAGIKTSIRKFKDHSGELTDILATPKNRLITASRDNKINIYDLTEGTLLKSLEVHGNYINRLLIKNNECFGFSNGVFKINLTDFLLSMVFEHSNMIEYVCSGEDYCIYFTSGNKIFEYNTQTNEIVKFKIIHIRGITKLQLYQGKLYTCSLDKHFKTLNIDFQTINDFNIGCKLVSFAFSDVSGMPLIATADGKILGVEEEVIKVKQVKFVDRRPKYEDNIDFEVVQVTKKRLSEVESMLRRFEYKGALIYCMQKGSINEKYAVLKYISDKRCIKRALQDGDVNFLIEVLCLCLELIKISEFTSIIVEMLYIITTCYSEYLIEDKKAHELLEMISEAVNEQALFEEILLKACSFIESFNN